MPRSLGCVRRISGVGRHARPTSHRDMEASALNENHEPDDEERVSIAKRFGISLDERDLAIARPVYQRHRQMLERLRALLATDDEPAVTFAAAFPEHER